MNSILALALAAAVPQAGAATAAPNYADDATWLCRPGGKDACTQDLSTTVIAADGKRSAERFTRAANPSFDCFYVYPTVSRDSTPNSDLTAGPEEQAVIAGQAARFGSVCRVFAPMYRQVTLTALRDLMTGKTPAIDRMMAYNDVKAAWDDYLRRDNKGRGVVLIGHSQGSFVLKELIAKEIEGKPVQSRIISAMLIGANVGVPAGADVGGDLKVMPLCRRADQVGCVVTYVSFRADQPPPGNSRFGKVAESGLIAGCTNPAALGGGRATLRASLPAVASAPSTAMGPWTADKAAVTTPFVAVPGLLSAECVAKDGFGYLAVTTNGDPADPRTDTIGGDVQLAPGVIARDWGLHLIDVNLAHGDLVALASSQAAAWSKVKR